MAPRLPTETLHEIALYLPRHVLKSLLLFQPHPVGRVASYLYFSVVSLHFGVRDSDRYSSIWGESNEMIELTEWHEKRSYGILIAIIENNDFAKRVQRLKIYSPGSKDTDALTFQIGLLAMALPKMTRLKVLECYGLLMPLRTTISTLSETVPLLQRLRLGDRVNRRGILKPGDVRVHRLSHLDQLTLCEGWYDHLSLTDLLKDLETLSIKRLHISCPRITITGDVLARFTTPALISILTHLSLRTHTISIGSAFEMALSYGVNLQSLRIEGFHRSPSSQHFRRYAHALPSLTEFGIFLYSDTQNWPDTDFFPAVCDFLRPKAAQLVHLELRAPQEKLQQDALGFDGGKQCWGLFKSDSRSGAAKLFPKLESLSMTLPEGNKSFPLHCSKLIPKGVTRLSLSGYQLVGIPIKNVFKVSQAKVGPSWPPNLRLVCLIANPGIHSTKDNTLAQMVAECIVTVRVVRFVTEYCKDRGFWLVSRTVTSGDSNVGNGQETGPLMISCKQLDTRETTCRAELLDRYDCEDNWFEDW